MTQSPTRLPAEALTDEQRDEMAIAQFERFAAEKFLPPLVRHKFFTDSYEDPLTGHLWTAYREAYKQASRDCIAAAPIAQPEGDAWVRGEEDADGNSLITVRKDEWERLNAAEPVAQPAGAVPGIAYLCRAWGESDLPAAAIVTGLEGVRAFLIAEWLGDSAATHDDGTNSLEAAMQDMQEQWSLEGEAWEWSAEFEIGGVSVQKVGHASIETDLAAPTHVPENSGGDGWQPIKTAPLDGREVLLMVESRAGVSCCQLVGHYMPGGHCIEDHPPIGSGWYFWTGAMFDCASKPTHWMPLPAAPSPEPATRVDGEKSCQ